MAKEFFSVGCQGVAFHNGVVIVDLAGLSQTESDEKGRPKRELTARVIMTADGAVETFDALRGMLDKLVEVGVLKRGEGSAAGAGGGGKEGQGNIQPTTPNF